MRGVLVSVLDSRFVGRNVANETCVVNAYTYANCTGEHYTLNAVGCWVQFEVENVDLGVQGVSVACAATASEGSASASASASAMNMERMIW